MKNQKFSLSQRLKSFVYAFHGLKILLKEEHNARIHLIVAILVIIAGVVLEISTIEWIAVVFAIGFVITTEIVNSAIENIADFVSLEKQPKIKKIKDIAAAGVLISAVTALIIGMIIFLPKILEF